MPRLNDPQEMSLIYEKCKQVYSGEITRKTNNNPRKYKLLDVARDYSINIIGEL